MNDDEALVITHTSPLLYAQQSSSLSLSLSLLPYRTGKERHARTHMRKVVEEEEDTQL